MTTPIGFVLTLDGERNVTDGMRRVGGSVDSVDGAVGKLRSSLGGLAGAFGAAVGVREFFQAADAVTSLNNKLTLATGSAQAAASAYGQLFDIAQRSRVGFVELGNTFASISTAAADMGVSQGRLLKVTEAIGNAVTISGSSAQATQAALVQLGQGLASGTLRGEELNSVMEQTPRLAKAIADGMGITRGELRALGAQGAITAEQVIKALESQSEVLRKEIGGSVLTVGQAFTQLRNNAVMAAGDMDKASGATTMLAQSIGDVSTALGALRESTAVLGTLKTAGETLGVLYNNIAFVFGTLGREIGGIAAQAAAVARLDFGGAATIRRELIADAAAARARLDAADAAILGKPSKAASETLDTSAEDARLSRHTVANLIKAANAKAIDSYLNDNSRQTQAQIREEEIAKARKRNAELMAKAEGDTNTQLRLQAALKTEIANIESRYKDKGAGGASATANAYKELTHSLADKIKLGELELATDGKVSESQKLRARYAVDLTDKLKGLGAAERAVIESQLQTLEAQERKRAIGEGDLKLAQMLAQQRQDEVRGIEAYMQAQEDASRKSLQSVQDRIAGLQDEEQAISTAAAQNVSLAEAVELVAIARLREEQARYNDVEGGRYREIEKEIEARQKLLGVMRGREFREANKRAADEAARDWDRTAETISSTLQDYIMAGGKNAADYLKRLFSTLVLQPVVKTLVGGAMGALGFAAPAAAGTSALSTVGNIGGIYSGLSSATTAGLLPSGISAALAGSTNAFAMGLSGAWGAGGGLMSTLGAGTSLIGSGSIMSGLGVMAGALGPIALGLGALVSLLGKKSTPHIGGGATYGADMGLITGAASNDFIREWTIPESAYRDEANKAAATMAKTISQTLDGVAKQFGQQMGYVVGTGFADDSSKDGAWGALRIALGDRTVADWGNPDDKWAGVTFADGEQGAKEYANKVAGTVREVIDGMDLPGWASRIAKSMPAEGTMDDLTAVLATISSYPAELLQRVGTSRDALVEQYAKGLASGNVAAAGQSVADTLVQSIQNAVYTTASGAVFDIVNQGIVTPMLDAIATGASVSEALSQATIDQTIERAKTQAKVLGDLFGNADFAQAMQQLRGAVSGALGGAGGYIQSLPNTLAATQAIDSAAQDAAKAAEEARKKWQDLTDGLLSDRDQLAIDLLRAQGREEAALAAERVRGIKGLDDYQTALWDANTATRAQIAELEKLNSLRDEERQLQIQMLQARGDTVGALALMTQGMADAERAAYLYNDTLRKQIDVVNSIASELPGVIGKYTSDAQKLAAGYQGISIDLSKVGIDISADVLAAATKGQIADAAAALYNLGTTSDETRLALIRAASGLSDLMDMALGLAQGRTDAAYSALEREVNTRKTVVQETIADVRSVFDAVGDAARSLYGEVSSTSAMLGAQGRAFIDQALGNARATGYLPDPKDLQRAIQAATGDLGKQVYATQFEADRDRLLLAGKLSDLESISGDQLTEAEKQLKSLDGILDNARQQIDALRGIDTSVLGVDARIAMLTDAILAERTARNAVKTGGGGGGGGLGGAGGPLMPGWANWGKGDWVVNAGGSLVADAASGTIYSQGGQNLYRSSLVDAATALIEAGQSMDVYDAIKQSGFTLAQADKVLGLQSGTAEDWAKAMGLPIFHAGTSYVPQTGLALLEQGERVIKASDNRALMASLQGGGVSTARLEAQLDQLLDDNRRQAGEIIRLQGQMAKLMSKWDDEGQPEEREAITA